MSGSPPVAAQWDAATARYDVEHMTGGQRRMNDADEIVGLHGIQVLADYLTEASYISSSRSSWRWRRGPMRRLRGSGGR